MNRLLKYACPLRDQGCSRRFRSQGGRTYHIRTCHTNYNILVIHSDSLEPQAVAPEPDIPFQYQDMDIPQHLSPSPPPPTLPKKEYHPWLTGEDVFYH